MRTRLLFLIVIISFSGNGQIASNDSMPSYSSKEIQVYTKDYMREYNRLKKLIVKVYPYALHAADMLDEINNNVESIEKRRKQNKYLKESYEDLKDEFKYVFYEFYTSEGVMLMKLVHRETGLTVYEIAETYRGKRNAEVFELMGKLWDQDINIKFDPNGRDKIAEHVIRDIQSGMIPFKDEVVILTKEEFKVEQANDRERKKTRKQQQKQQEKEKKLRDKEKRGE